MTVALRAHHLLCLLTYVGKGYDAEFVRHYDAIAGRLSNGESIRIVEGPDDICASLIRTQDGAHCAAPRIIERDVAAAADLMEQLGIDAAAGTRIDPTRDWLASMRAAFATGGVRRACTGCDWHPLCTQVADAGYRAVRFERG